VTTTRHPDEAPRDATRVDAMIQPGLPSAIDAVAAAAPETHRFLRRQWYAAAVAAYGGVPRTVVVRRDDTPVAALPLVATGPRWLRAATVPGCYWPFRSLPIAEGAGGAVADAMLAAVAPEWRALRLGPVYDGDPAATLLLSRARASGWGVVDRTLATSFALDMAAARAEGAWPRTSTLKKNRFHEKHLAEHGALEWCFVSGAGWADAFDRMATIEERSWQAGHDAKFTATGHGAFFRAAAQDPVIAAMFHAALLTIDGVPTAFSFDLDAGTLKYAIANSYDPVVAKHSPGKLLYYRNLVEALGRGVERVDWGAGDSGYKRVIGATEGPAIRDWLLLRPGIMARVAPAARGLMARR
jgi:CelD/BcsL family acetyltransferase involved in cellulose biosynthesis